MAGHTKFGSEKTRKRIKRKGAIRKRINGTADRPRLSVFRSARYVYAQAIDDTTGRVLAAASDTEEKLGGAASKIRSFRPPEPYKGKGIKYKEETILRKAGKTAGK